MIISPKNDPSVNHYNDKWLLITGIFAVGILMPTAIAFFSEIQLAEAVARVSGTFVNTILLWFGCRFIITKLWEALPWQKYPLKHLLAEILLITSYTLIVSGIIMLMTRVTLSIEMCMKFSFWENFLISNSISLIISFIHEGIFFFDQWKKSYIKSEILEKENLISQFETLKNQINPHFLFNSFNTLITLIEEDKESAANYTQKLSDFFRTILQINTLTMIPLAEELELINTYFFLQQKRYGNNLQLGTDIPETYLKSGVPPLCLQMLVENAIKHNIISTGKPLLIEIEISEQGYIIVRNNLQKRLVEEEKPGIGIENIKNRYRFLTDKPVEVVMSAKHFIVALPVLPA
jgi:sensor histidine kinase YesM